jgi:hypothetical protein
MSTSPTTQLCNGACIDTSNDINNCGACGNVVSRPEAFCL